MVPIVISAGRGQTTLELSHDAEGGKSLTMPTPPAHHCITGLNLAANGKKSRSLKNSACRQLSNKIKAGGGNERIPMALRRRSFTVLASSRPKENRETVS